MKKIIVFSILLLSAIAVTVGTTITTTIQIQPAYSQAQHCTTQGDQRECVTPGKDPSRIFCVKSACTPDIPTTGDIAGQAIGQIHQNCARGGLNELPVSCTVTPP